MGDGTRIIVDGQEYGSVEEMPPRVRKVYDSLMQAARSAGGGQGGSARIRLGDEGFVIRSDLVEETRVEVDGDPVDPADLPPALREVYDRYVTEAGTAGSHTGEGHRGRGESRGGEDGARTPTKEEAHFVKVVHASWSGGSSGSGGSGRRRGVGGPSRKRSMTLINLVLLAICAVIVTAIFLAA